MDLITYLTTHFLTRAQLLDACAAGDAELAALQDGGKMPRASYRLAVQLDCTSFFGQHHAETSLEFHARGYASWLGILRGGCADPYAVFCARYRGALEAQPLRTRAARLNEGLEMHLREEWRHFLDGTYGLCTRTGLPEQIAEKELAIAVIQEEMAHGGPQLRAAVDLLDAASSPFAPHERERSSRERYVNALRRRFAAEDWSAAPN
ncbi:MAG: DUF6058 family natural product biosynthesis protein [Telluria sp.]